MGVVPLWLSLAGVGATQGKPFRYLLAVLKPLKALRAEGRTPRTIVLENVYGTITSHGGKDFAAICTALAAERYRFGAMLIDAVHFVPQSRPRLFIVAIEENLVPSTAIVGDAPDGTWHPPALTGAYAKLPRLAKGFARLCWRAPPRSD